MIFIQLNFNYIPITQVHKLKYYKKQIIQYKYLSIIILKIIKQFLCVNPIKNSGFVISH